MPVYVGTSGWQYKHWRNTFYPEGVAQSRWLEYYAERWQVVELNNSFYRLPSEATFAKWAERTPADFVFAVKMSRYLTHIKRLADPAEPIERFLSHAHKLGPKLGPVLIQLPPNLKIDTDALAVALGLFPADVRVAVEFRHESWFTDEVRRCLVDHGAAACLADRNARPVTPVWRTAEWTFVRFHEGTGSPHPCYKRSSLNLWVDRLADEWGPDSDIFVFFNNDALGCAVRDASVFATAVEAAGLRPSRVPDATDVTVG
ncbi:MAG: DUF72 domain-containing protein [Actinomycetota bacterium]